MVDSSIEVRSTSIAQSLWPTLAALRKDKFPRWRGPRRSLIFHLILYLSVFSFFPSSSFRGVTCCMRFVLRIEISFGGLLSGRIAKAGRFIQCRRTKHTLYFLLLVHFCTLSIFNSRTISIYAEIFR